MTDNLQEIHHYTSDEKLKWWGYGEWVEELDEVRFVHKGIECRIIRIAGPELDENRYGGHLCGYIKVPKDHVCYGKGYDDIEIDVHGGLTYSEIDQENHNYLPPEGHWIGFDCVHAGDYHPSVEYMKKTMPELIEIERKSKERLKKFGMNENIFQNTYKNINYCIQECKSVVEQLNLKRNECEQEKTIVE